MSRCPPWTRCAWLGALSLALGCSPEVDRANPYDPAAPPAVQARGRIAGELVPPPTFGVHALADGRILLHAGPGTTPTAAERVPVERADGAVEVFAFDDLAPGGYRLEIEVPGFGFADGRLIHSRDVALERGQTLLLDPLALTDVTPPEPAQLELAGGASATRSRIIEWALPALPADVVALRLAGDLVAEHRGTFSLAERPPQLELTAGAGVKVVRAVFFDAAGNASPEVVAAIGYAFERPAPIIERVEPEALPAFTAAPEIVARGAGIAADTRLRVGQFDVPCASDAAVTCRVEDPTGCATACRATLPAELMRFAETYFVTLSTPEPVATGDADEATFATLDIVAPRPELRAITPRGVVLRLDEAGRPMQPEVAIEATVRRITDNAVFRLDDAVGRLAPEPDGQPADPEAPRPVTVTFDAADLRPADLRDAVFSVANPSPGGGVATAPFGLNPAVTPCAAVEPCRSNLRGTRAAQADGRAVAQAFAVDEPGLIDGLRVGGDVTAVQVRDDAGRLLERHEATGGTIPLLFDRRATIAVLEDARGRAPTVTLRRGGRLGAAALSPLPPAGGDASASGVAVVDLDGDGRPEIVSGVEGEPRLEIRQLDGGAFVRRPGAIDAPVSTRAIAAADLDGDGALDLLLTGPASHAVTFGRGDGTFDPRMALSTGAGIEGIPRVADLDRDGRPDVIECVGGALYWRRNAGQRVFDRPARLEGVPEGACRARLADMDGDGRLDLLALDPDGRLDLAFGRGAGGFVDARALLEGGVAGFDIADFDGDGRLDVVAADGQGVRLIRGGVRGPLAVEALAIEPAPQRGAIRLVDLDRDGWPDVLWFADDGPRWCLGAGGGALGACARAGWQPPELEGLPDGARWVAARWTVEDVDGDGAQDVIGVVTVELDRQICGRGERLDACLQAALAPAPVRVWRDAGRPIDGPVSVHDTQNAGVILFRAIDLDRDGHVDIVGSLRGRGVAWAAGPDFDETHLVPLIEPFRASLGGELLSLDLAPLGAPDLDRDGVRDLVFPAHIGFRGGLGVLPGADWAVGVAPGDIVEARDLGASLLVRSLIAFGDLNGEGELDLVISGRVREDAGGGMFVDRWITSAVAESAADGPDRIELPGFDTPINALAVGDMNADGRADVLGSGDGGTRLALGEPGGGMGFREVEAPLPDGDLYGAELADIDRDGDLDLLALAQVEDGPALVALSGVGDGRFVEVHRQQLWSELRFGAPLAVDDLDGDGLLDVVAAAGYRVGIARGRGDGTFEPLVIRDFSAIFDPLQDREVRGVDTGDRDGDGMADILISGLIVSDEGRFHGGAVWWGLPKPTTRQVLSEPFAPRTIAAGGSEQVEVGQGARRASHLAARVGLEGLDGGPVVGVGLTLTPPGGAPIELDSDAGDGGVRWQGSYGADAVPALEALIGERMPAGEWLLTVEAGAAPVRLTDFAVITVSRPLRPMCGDVPALDVSRDPIEAEGDTADAVRRYHSRCAAGTLPGRDVAFAFTAPAAGRWRVAVDADFEAVVSIRDTCVPHRGFERACAAPGGAATVELDEGEGVYVVVDGVGRDAAGPFRLRVERAD